MPLHVSVCVVRVALNKAMLLKLGDIFAKGFGAYAVVHTNFLRPNWAAGEYFPNRGLRPRAACWLQRL